MLAMIMNSTTNLVAGGQLYSCSRGGCVETQIPASERGTVHKPKSAACQKSQTGLCLLVMPDPTIISRKGVAGV